MGRVCASLAPLAQHVLGIDMSTRMLALARRRCAEHRNVLLAQTSGRDLAMLAMFRQYAMAAGLEPIRLGTRDLAWWDGITYHVRRAG